MTERSKKENEFRLSFDRSVYCLYWFKLYLTSNTFAKLYDSDHIIFADKAAPLKHCQLKSNLTPLLWLCFLFRGVRFLSCSCVDILSGCEWMIRLCYSPTKPVIWYGLSVMVFKRRVSASIFFTRKTANQEALRVQQSKSNQSTARKILQRWRYVLHIMTGLWRSIRGRFLLFILRKASIKLFWVQQSLVTCSKTKRGLKNIL